jgi:hypothetical protein
MYICLPVIISSLNLVQTPLSSRSDQLSAACAL